MRRTAINEAYARNEGMRVRFAKDKEGTWYQYVMDPEEKDIEFKDFSNVSLEEAEAEMQKWTTVPFKMFDAPLTRVVMIKMPDGFNGVYFLGNHMIVDAQSLICFLKDIIELYCNAKYEGVPYPKDMASYIEQIERDSNISRKRSRKASRSIMTFTGQPSWSPCVRCSRIRNSGQPSVLQMIQSRLSISSIWRKSLRSV